jgi:transposase-like protein
MSKFWTTLFGMLRVKLRPSSAYHPKTDGQREVVNRKVEEILRCFVGNNQSNWDLFLVALEFAYTRHHIAQQLFPILSHLWEQAAWNPIRHGAHFQPGRY